MSRRPIAAESHAAMVAGLRDVFRARGWDGASLADLSAATGLSRATLYHHFPGGKADMAAAALSDVETRLERELLAPLKGDGAARLKLGGMIMTLEGYYRGGDLGCLLGALAQGQDEHGLGARVAASFEGWIDTLAALAAEAGVDAARARDNAAAVIAAIQGALVLSAGTRQPKFFRTTLERLPDLLFAR